MHSIVLARDPFAPAPARATDAATATSRDPAPADSIQRPDPGLASGRWEAPAWAFAALAVLTVLGGLAWLAMLLRGRRRRGGGL